VPTPFVTEMSTVPAGWGGTVTVSEISELIVKAALILS